MAATYVQIQRDEFENWLFQQCPVFERVPNKQGIYRIPVSDDVALYISTSIGREDQAVAKGHGACHMKLQGRHNDRCLNRKDLGQTRFNRTTGWKVNWAIGIDRLSAAYEEHADFYDRLGRQTQAEYAVEVRARIEAITGWTARGILRSFHDQVGAGKWLSAKQEAVIEDLEGLSATIKVDSTLLSASKTLLQTALNKNDTWLCSFLGSCIKRLEIGRDLTTRQDEVLRDNLNRYQIAA